MKSKRIKTRSLRTRTLALMSLLVALQSLALVFALIISKVFFSLDAEAFRLFDSTVSSRAAIFNDQTNKLVGDLAETATQLTTQVNQTADREGIPSTSLFMNDTAYLEAAQISTEQIRGFLYNNNVTGAFVMFNGSNGNKNQETRHSAIYIRDTTPSNHYGDNSNYQLELGPVAISSTFSLPSGINWGIDWKIDPASPDSNYYTQPIQAAKDAPNSEIERYGYWSAPFAILDDHKEVVTYTMPLLDTQNQPYGIIGFEISLAHLTRSFLPNTEIPYENSFYAIANVQGDSIQLDWSIPSGPLAQVHLTHGSILPLTYYEANETIYKTHVSGLGPMYCDLQPLTMYSQNSPFYENGWTLIGFVPQPVMHATSSHVCTLLVGSIITTTLLSFIAVFFLTYWSTRQISHLPVQIRSFNPQKEVAFKKTGFQEIDDLTSAIELLNRSVVNTSKITSKIMDLTSMPMGCFEINRDASYVTVTDYIYTLLHKELGQQITILEWTEIYAHITSHPATEYENTFRYTSADGNSIWLRIQQEDTPNGYVGTILDVSADIEKAEQLAHELDYDSLTHLYSRVAFKREATALIRNAPDKIGTMIFADIDNLKYVNDTFGHDVGDRFLIKAAEMFTQFTRIGGIVSRISGDEFAIYLHGYDSKDAARADFKKQFNEHRGYNMTGPDGKPLRIRSSTGIAWYPDDSNNVTDLLKLSDYAMYEAKNKKKGTLFEFNQASYKANSYLLENREAINRLIDEALIRFAFQAIVSLETGEIYAYEALMRPLLENFKSPLEILSVASAQSKLNQLERLVIFTAYQYVSEHIHEIGDTKIFVNSIPSQRLSDEDFSIILRRYAHIHNNMVVEITEDENDSLEFLKNKVASVKNMGIMVAIDDYGSGYSNELRILQIAPDIIKIDMGILQGIHSDADKQALVSNIISFCKAKNIKTIGEGIETKEDLTTIMQLGVNYVQGYLLGKPDFELKPVNPEIVNYIKTFNKAR